MTTERNNICTVSRSWPPSMDTFYSKQSVLKLSTRSIPNAMLIKQEGMCHKEGDAGLQHSKECIFTLQLWDTYQSLISHLSVTLMKCGTALNEAPMANLHWATATHTHFIQCYFFLIEYFYLSYLFDLCWLAFCLFHV